MAHLKQFTGMTPQAQGTDQWSREQFFYWQEDQEVGCSCEESNISLNFLSRGCRVKRNPKP